jgi:hypothetical protein
MICEHTKNVYIRLKIYHAKNYVSCLIWFVVHILCSEIYMLYVRGLQ